MGQCVILRGVGQVFVNTGEWESSTGPQVGLFRFTKEYVLIHQDGQLMGWLTSVTLYHTKVFLWVSWTEHYKSMVTSLYNCVHY